ncbi:sn1-specific diacylglycerol lipase alpha isoform X2 [Brachypodium distachyon]|uniref:Fungal lipase-type domain-containing protein n=1 Tax=Brachypodium distachyon TaxID=15368 RepID=A0A0Q3PDW8_BRADI|nr:sn1-specific diacylglycerol lipase alpha isoform X2 [Brachypodium distachyon]KQJ87433.2 hypothetical protein BRADI_4g11080v3 [Brachypodium distachyon]|eukprot:XP_024318702.1 sn1-specific diacylglycerol lipase alpha isoform X2 [Brachypodium distachyon]
MGAKAAALSAAGSATLLYVVLSGRLSSEGPEDSPWRRRPRREAEGSEETRWPERAPASWREAAAVAARTVGFAYGETLGKWPLGDIAFGIRHYMRLQGNLQHEYAGSNSVPLEGPGVRQEMIALLRYLRLCMFFSKKPYEVFLRFGGYDQSDILIEKSKLMRPAFTIVRDESTRCFLLFIRGAISVKDRLTAATAAEVPFHHAVFQEGRGSRVVFGHAHCGMVAAARWIADQAIPCLSRAVEQFPDYRIKIIGHSMGAGIAALLTYILRENKKLSSSSCIAFGPAACMTWDLAESGKDFITTIVNGNDLVPSLGKVSATSLRTEVMASSWAPDLQKQIQQKIILGLLNNSVNFMLSRIPFISNSRRKVPDVDMLLSHTSEAETTKLSEDALAAVLKKHSALSYWPYVAANRQAVEPVVNPTHSITGLMSTYVKGTEKCTEKQAAGEQASCSPGEADKEVDKQTDGDEHMEQLLEALRSSSSSSASELPPHCQLYPPGRIMHMVALPATEEGNKIDQGRRSDGVALYDTPRGMYGKIRLARSMVRDHYMPRYVETMEMLVSKLTEDDAPLDDTNNPLD